MVGSYDSIHSLWTNCAATQIVLVPGTLLASQNGGMEMNL